MSDIEKAAKTSGPLSKEIPFKEEGIAAEDSEPEKVGTTTDYRDMARLGKAQQFKVRILSTIRCVLSTLTCSA